MKQTIKVALITTLLAIGITATAQQNKIVFGAKAGFLFSDMSSGYPNHTKIKHAFTGGLTLDYYFSRDFYLASGLEFANKGSKHDIVNEHAESRITFQKSTIAAMYLQIPIHAGYKFDLSRETRLHVQAGPYIAYGLGGDTELGDIVKIEDGDGTVLVDLNDYVVTNGLWKRGYNTFSDEAFRRFDWGVGLAAAVEYQHVNIGLKFDLGLYNIDRQDNKVKNRTGYVTLGYKF